MDTFKYLGITQRLDPMFKVCTKSASKDCTCYENQDRFMLTPNFYYCCTGVSVDILQYLFFYLLCLSQTKYASPHLQNCFQDRPPHTACLSADRKAHVVANDPAHPLNTEFDLRDDTGVQNAKKNGVKNMLSSLPVMLSRRQLANVLLDNELLLYCVEIGYFIYGSG